MNGERTEFEPVQLREFRAQLQANPALAVEALQTFPPVPEPETVLIRCDAAHVDKAIARAVALAAIRREFAEIELV
ncbi:MAG: hypothetical protein ABSG54_14245 [Terriglobia bacterium]|jgi:hypothetical protein